LTPKPPDALLTVTDPNWAMLELFVTVKLSMGVKPPIVPLINAVPKTTGAEPKAPVSRVRFCPPPVLSIVPLKVIAPPLATAVPVTMDVSMVRSVRVGMPPPPPMVIEPPIPGPAGEGVVVIPAPRLSCGLTPATGIRVKL